MTLVTLSKATPLVRATQNEDRVVIMHVTVSSVPGSLFLSSTTGASALTWLFTVHSMKLELFQLAVKHSTSTRSTKIAF